jgi:hypothetical protein
MNADTPNGPTALHQIDLDHISGYYAAPKSARRIPRRSGFTSGDVGGPAMRLAWSGPLRYAAG